jgi:hypothetical protein
VADFTAAVSEKRMKGIKAAVLEQRFCAQPLPVTSSTAQDAASAEAERLQKKEQLRERKAGKEKRRQQARQKLEASEEAAQAGAGAMEPAEEEAKDDDKSIAVFLEWCDGLGYETLERFRDADEDDIDSIPLSPEQVGRVLSLLQESTPAAWHPSSCTPAVRDPPPPLGPATAADDHAAGEEVDGMCVICYAAPVTVQLVHANETSHQCVCVGCSDILKARGDPCPVCRAVIIARVRSNFISTQVLFQ